jgi:hypothetical protein
MTPLYLIPMILTILLPTITAAQQVQFCHQRAVRKSDICLALTTSPNVTTGETDLHLHLSAKLPDPGKGWVGFGVGVKMDHALMFSMYGGKTEGCKYSPQSMNLEWNGCRNYNVTCRQCVRHKC